MTSKSIPSTSRPGPISRFVPCDGDQPIIDIDNSDEDVALVQPVASISQASPVNSKAKKRRLRMLIIEVDSDDDTSPQSIDEYESWDKGKRKAYRNQIARVAKDALEEKDREKQSREISRDLYADNGTIGLISNLNINDKAARTTSPQSTLITKALDDKALEIKVPSTHIVHALIQQTAFKIYRGYGTLREAERVWALANGIGSARALNASSQAIGLPSGPFPSLEDGDDYEGADWFTVIKGRIPGIYPVWNFDPTQGFRVGNNGLIVTTHATRALAQQEFDDAARAGLVRSIEIVF
ncbi:hypothetical protein HWV62_10465 [Athelia sp. TMB]|nr:hypothetical protein HWV62_10465 [Athelia sp. TMB]